MEETSLQQELQRYSLVKEFYSLYRYRAVWINNKTNCLQLIKFLEQAPQLGLDTTDYRIEYIRSMYRSFSLPAGKDSLLAELHMTDAAIHFFNDVAYGNKLPAIRYNGLNYLPGCKSIPSLLAAALPENRFPAFLKEVEPVFPAYHSLKKNLGNYQAIISKPGFKDEQVTTGDTTNNRPLLIRLYQLGIIDTLPAAGSSLLWKEKIKKAQHLFTLPEDGIAGVKTRRALNIPLTRRVEELKTAINTIRWLHCTQQWPAGIIVNIPSAGLELYENGKKIMYSKVIVGKRATPTPAIITANITEVVLYPYWMVPKRIATRELLPLIKRNSGYLDANNLQVLNLQGKVVKPSSIDWQLLSAGNFPYILRQSTGCDNSLGLVKLNFYTPFTIYLHDTPWKELFKESNRYFSHGCIRVEKALELARYVLSDNSIAVDTLTEKGCLNNQRPVPVPVMDKVPVFIIYSTAWPDEAGSIRFFTDVYGRL